MSREGYAAYKVRLAMLKAWRDTKNLRDSISDPERKLLETEYTSIRTSVSLYRQLRQPEYDRLETPPPFVEREKDRSRQLARKSLWEMRPRTTVSISITSGIPNAGKEKRAIRVAIKGSWAASVYDKIYKGIDLEKTTNFILQATEMRTNVKRMKVFTARNFNLKTGETSNAYVTIPETKNRMFFVSQWLKAAVEMANEAIAEEATKAMIGESNDK